MWSRRSERPLDSPRSMTTPSPATADSAGAELPYGARAWATLTGTSPSPRRSCSIGLPAWQEEFDEYYDYEAGGRSGVARDHWTEEAKELTAELHAALGTRAKLVVEPGRWVSEPEART